MTEIYPSWLSKEMLAGVRRFNIDSYLLALEGWRRGLSLKFYETNTDKTDLKRIGFDPKGKLFSLTSEDKTHFFYRTRGDKVANEAVDIGTDKALTKKYLKYAGVPVPEGFGFTSNTPVDEVIDSVFQQEGPYVLKPTFGSLGKGVTTNIRTEEMFRENLAYIQSNFDYTDFLVEQHISGEDMRVYVAGNEVVAATKRTPANVTGDGSKTIEELINDKNEIRKENPHTSTRLMKIDDRMKDYLTRQNLQLTDIPKTDQLVYLKGESNMSAGGDSVDVTNDLRPDVKAAAINAVKAVPGLHHAGIDMIVSADTASVIEINVTAGSALHVFPMHGEHQNIAEKIIDYYFQETKDTVKSNQLYFDYKSILQQFRSNAIKEIEITDAPVGELYAKRYVISGKVQNVGYRIWAENQAVRQGLHGYVKNLKDGNVVVVVASTDKEKVDAFKDICYEGPKRAEVENIREYKWDKRVRIGFEIRQ
ncbi:acylphosphatase [Salinicoccus albus]|uniref:acylphosphatase n=1 Tax=Salinicoccus albus TaxID=418756 RepID=UPI0003715F3D|nr:acylphosphatase [Salinicoccus albus]